MEVPIRTILKDVEVSIRTILMYLIQTKYKRTRSKMQEISRMEIKELTISVEKVNSLTLSFKNMQA